MTEPTDAEIIALMRDGNNCNYNDEAEHIDFTRAVLARWGQPAHSGEPVAWLDPWTGTKVTTDYDAYGKHGIPLYTAPQPAPAPLSDDTDRLRQALERIEGASMSMYATRSDMLEHCQDIARAALAAQGGK